MLLDIQVMMPMEPIPNSDRLELHGGKEQEDISHKEVKVEHGFIGLGRKLVIYEVLSGQDRKHECNDDLRPITWLQDSGVMSDSCDRKMAIVSCHLSVCVCQCTSTCKKGIRLPQTAN